ncbi:MAG: sugar O-acetyltransferase [Bacteroidota bacterium]
MTELEKMLASQLYDASDPELTEMRHWSREMQALYNKSSSRDIEGRKALLEQWFGEVVGRIDIQPPFFCDYGKFIFAEDNVFMNFNCVILDVNPVRIGANTMFGPNVQVYTAYHPLQANERIKGPELGAPVSIGKNCWIGGGVIICQGVTIGDNTTIGAGSVVTKDIPANVFAAGIPCKVIKTID